MDIPVIQIIKLLKQQKFDRLLVDILQSLNQFRK